VTSLGINNTLPLDFRLLEIDRKADVPPRGPQVVDALRDVLVGETLHAFEFDNQNVLDKNVGRVLADALALIICGKRDLRNSPDATEAEFLKQSPFIDLLEKPRTESIGDLKDSPKYPLSQQIRASEFI
jgi:hypothetical protein